MGSWKYIKAVTIEKLKKRFIKCFSQREKRLQICFYPSSEEGEYQDLTIGHPRLESSS